MQEREHTIVLSASGVYRVRMGGWVRQTEGGRERERVRERETKREGGRWESELRERERAVERE